MHSVSEVISQEYAHFIQGDSFPCVAAKAALQHNQALSFVAGHIACPNDDLQILEFLYHFIDEYRASEKTFHSAAIIFRQPEEISEHEYEIFLWQRLQSLSNMDAKKYPFDNRVSTDTQSPEFSFSLKSEAFFIIGLHSQNSRIARRFKYPTIVFNPHAAFSQLRERKQYDKMKKIVRTKDLQISGSVNPMLDDFGESSEVFQYSGKSYPSSWQCPLQINHGKTNNTAT